MTTKYGLAKELLAELESRSNATALNAAEVQEALLVSLVDLMKRSGEHRDLRGLLQYELDNLGGGTYDLPRGGGHS